MLLSKSVTLIILFRIFFFLFGLPLLHSLQLYILNEFYFLRPPTQIVASSFLLDELVSLTHKGNGVITSFPDQHSFPECKFLASLCSFSPSLASEENVSLLYKGRTFIYVLKPRASFYVSGFCIIFFSLLSIRCSVFSTAFSSNPVVLNKE